MPENFQILKVKKPFLSVVFKDDTIIHLIINNLIYIHTYTNKNKLKEYFKRKHVIANNGAIHFIPKYLFSV